MSGKKLKNPFKRRQRYAYARKQSSQLEWSEFSPSFDKDEEESKVAKDLREKAYQLIENDDLTSLLNLIEVYKSTSPDVKEILDRERWTLESNIFINRKNNENLLHMALEGSRRKCANYMIEHFHTRYLLYSYINIDAQIPPSRKSCLHIIVEKGDGDLFELFLTKLEEIPAAFWAMISFMDDHLNEFLNKTVVVKISDQTGNQPDVQIDKDKRRVTPVHLAVLNGHHHLIEPMKRHYFKMDVEDNFGETPLMWAIWAGKAVAFDKLINCGADINHVNQRKCSPLHIAVTCNQIKMADRLIEDPRTDLNARRIKAPQHVLEIAASRNQNRLMRTFLLPQIRKRIDPRSIKNAIFIASKNGFQDTITEILEIDNSLVNITNNLGNTSVLVAADANKFELVKILIEKYKANTTVKNNLLETIYDIAMRQPMSGMFRYLIQNLTKNGLVYLHSAAAANDLEKMNFILINKKAKLLDIDSNGNTIFHTAAAYNSSKVLEKYLEKDDDFKDLQNNDGDTALHLAVRKGHLESFNALMKNNARIDLEDNNEQNVLHAAVSSVTSRPEIVKQIVEKMQQSYKFLLNKDDKDENTALHLAAKYSKADIMKLLSKLEPESENQNGETPLHCAVRYGTIREVETILQTFYNVKKINIDKQDKLGHSALFISAEIGDAKIFDLLLKRRADMTLRNNLGCTLLHKIIENYMSNETESPKFLEIYHIIVQRSVDWYCQKKSLKLPLKNSTQHYEYQLNAVRYLTSDLYYNGCNVLQYAAKLGAADLLKVILETPNVYKFTIDSLLGMARWQLNSQYKSGMSDFFQNGAANEVLYDVSYMIPSTLRLKEDLYESQEASEDRKTGVKRKKKSINWDLESPHNESTEPLLMGPIYNSIVKTEKENLSNQTISTKPQPKYMISCLEYLVYTKDQIYINKIFDDEPFKFLISKYWAHSRLGYEFLMWTHVLYMTLFTYFAIPTQKYLHDRFDQTGNNTGHDNESVISNRIFPFVLFLIWPALILIFEIITGFIFILSIKRHWRKGLYRASNVDETSGLMKLPLGIMHFILNNLSHLSSLAFCTITTIWFLMVCFNDNRKNIFLECLAAVFIFGWLHTINYVKGFKDWNALASIFKQIIFRDIIRFAYIYIFVLISFGYAVHVLLLMDSKRSENTADTIYLTFYKMLNPDHMLNDEQEESYEESGGRISMLAIVYAAYSILATVVLMNLLIAMMNKTYSDIQSNEATVWRINSLKFALWYERYNCKLPFKWASKSGHFYDKNENRHMIVVSFDSDSRIGKSALKEMHEREMPILGYQKSKKGKPDAPENMDLLKQTTDKIDNINGQLIKIRKELENNAADYRFIKNLILEMKEEIKLDMKNEINRIYAIDRGFTENQKKSKM